MDEHPIQGLMTTTMENLKEMIDVNTIVGDPVETPDGSIIIPVSKLGFGFAAGGTEFNNSDSGSDSESGEATLPFGGGSGGGVSVTPIAFLIVNSKGVKMVHLNENVHIYEKMIDFAPKAVEKIQQIIKESGNKQTPQKQSEVKGKPRMKHKEINDENVDDDWDSNYMI
ncbi:GerW family sporulation protein [Virgibacillus halophilus]|uniref:GerW family sporulation protein n=1 Tax=Tigheibacillus halophilus TaxID=361280 RepID=A0ABU5CCA6_9BACI|nr:GerW family sporulation protein [Virgibacillus halophilus]